MSVPEAFNRGIGTFSEISIEGTFDAAHRIVGHKGKCARLHGHTYKYHIMVRGMVVSPGFVVDFGDIKDLVNEWDHMTLLWQQDPLQIGIQVPLTGFQEDEGRTTFREDQGEFGVVRLQYNPTAELMAVDLARKIHDRWPNHEALMVELWETPKSMARFLL